MCFYFLIVSVFISQGDLKNAVVIEEKAEAEETNVKGIPDFWFTIFRNVDMLSELVQVSLPYGNSNFCHMLNGCFSFHSFQLLVSTWNLVLRLGQGNYISMD